MATGPRSRIPSPPPPPPDPLAARKAVSGAPTPRGFIPSPQAETPGGGAPGPAPSKRRDWKQLRGPAEEERRRLSSRAATQSPDAAAAAAAAEWLLPVSGQQQQHRWAEASAYRGGSRYG
ncbi:unnamed protein product [Lampetra fluviatilis]